MRVHTRRSTNVPCCTFTAETPRPKGDTANGVVRKCHRNPRKPPHHSCGCCGVCPGMVRPRPEARFREGSQWDSASIADAAESANRMLQRAYTALQQVPAGVRVAVCLPTLPFPPVFHTTSWNSGELELRLEESMAAFGTAISRLNGVTIVSGRKLAEQSPASSRYDFKSDIATGLPYTLSHADAVAAALAEVLIPTPPKKGIISDLRQHVMAWNCRGNWSRKYPLGSREPPPVARTLSKTARGDVTARRAGGHCEQE